jgi:RNA polymerase sigma factor (sigma-70 family)
MSTHNHILPAGGLEATSETVLFQQAQAGCRACLSHLMKHHARLVPYVVRRQKLGGLSFAAAVQAGRIGLWRAILGFDPQRGYAFSTYAYPTIARHVWRAVKQAARVTPLPVERGTAPTPDETDPAVIWEASLVRSALHELVGRLPERLQIIIIARYGLTGKPTSTYHAIGAVLGLTGERVRQLHTEALVWLRHPAHSQGLRALLGRHTLADYEAAQAQAQHWLRWRGGHHGR